MNRTTSTNRIDLMVDISVSVEDLKTWHPDRIRAFFDGLATVRHAAHKGDHLEQVKADWRQAEESLRHMERCLEALAATVGLDPDAPQFQGELWASKLTDAIVRLITVGKDGGAP